LAFGQWADFFLENYSEPPMRAAKTHEANERCIKHLKAAFGTSRLVDITADSIDLYLRERQGKVQDASDKLAVVNEALKDEVKGRHVLEDNLSAVTEQGKVDRQAALHDHLTGLPNRALFCDRLEHGIQQARRHDRRLAVMFVDWMI
jgi:GGDEF domain-containing protein